MDWQSIVAMIIVLLAALWLTRRVVRIVRSGTRGGAGSIGACGHCPKNPAAAEAQPLVALGRQPAKPPAETAAPENASRDR